MKTTITLPRLFPLLAILLAAFSTSYASPQEEFDRPGEGCMVRIGDQPSALPLKQTQVKISVTGFIASVNVEQTFTNPYKDRIEALYLFPLPSESAVDDMEVKIGERTIRGTVKEREEARRAYAEALNMGAQAALLEQSRPNVFMTSIANLDPGNDITVRIHYIERISYEDGHFRLVFPMVVAPRYTPRDGLKQAGLVNPPVTLDRRSGHNITINIDISAGFAIRKIVSPSHQIKSVKAAPSRYNVQLANLNEIPNKDFVLEYKIAGEQPEAVMLQGLEKDGEGYFMLMAAPPSDFQIKELRPKEMYFIIDTSGSMQGIKMEQAKNALSACLRGLNPQDTFNIIRFSSDFSAMSPRPLPFTQEMVDLADKYIKGLNANGGTEMLAPLKFVLEQPEKRDRLRVVVFITDGQINNEAQLLQHVSTNLKSTRIFTFGVDSAVHEFFLKKLARIGRGTAEFLLPHQQKIESVTNRFISRISAPMLTDLAIDWAGLDVSDVYPNPLPDLYINQPLFVVGKLRKGGQRQIAVQALSAVGLTSLPINIDTEQSNSRMQVLGKIWARNRIEQLGDQLYASPHLIEQLKPQIIQLAIEHKLVSAFTSFIALDEQIVPSPDGGAPRKVVVPVPVPDFWAGINQPPSERAMRNYLLSGSGNGAGGGFIGPQRVQPTAPPPMARRRSNVALGAPAPHKVAEPQVMAKSDSVADKKSRNVGLTESDVPAISAGRGRVARDASREDAELFLARNQAVNGAWSANSKTEQEAMRTTALAAISYLANGHTSRRGSYQPQSRRAVEFVTTRIEKDGTLRGNSANTDQLELQAIALWMMSESFALTNSDEDRKAADSLLNGLVKMRAARGKESASETAWSVIALTAAKKAGLTVDEKQLTDAATHLGGDSNLLQRSMVTLLAGRKLSAGEEKKVKDLLNNTDWSRQQETAVFALITARKLDNETLERVEESVSRAGDDSTINSAIQRNLTLSIGRGNLRAIE